MLHRKMDDYEEEVIQLDRAELIRLNQLIRGKIDYADFLAWYKGLPVEEQCALLYHLKVFASQAGYDAQTFSAALEEAHIDPGHPLAQQVASFRGDSSPELGDLLGWLTRLTDTERLVVFNIAVYLLGHAESRRYAGCSAFARQTGESCNHWWHRDLLDERVVKDLLSNPRYDRTSMKDDERLKQG